MQPGQPGVRCAAIVLTVAPKNVERAGLDLMRLQWRDSDIGSDRTARNARTAVVLTGPTQCPYGIIVAVVKRTSPGCVASRSRRSERH